MLPQWGCLNCIVKYKKQTYFLLRSGEKDKKTHTLTRVDFFLTSYIGPGDVSFLEEFKVTDGSSPDAFSPSSFYRSPSDGSTTDSPLGGAALGNRRAARTNCNTGNHHCSL